MMQPSRDNSTNANSADVGPPEDLREDGEAAAAGGNGVLRQMWRKLRGDDRNKNEFEF